MTPPSDTAGLTNSAEPAPAEGPVRWHIRQEQGTTPGSLFPGRWEAPEGVLQEEPTTLPTATRGTPSSPRMIPAGVGGSLSRRRTSTKAGQQTHHSHATRAISAAHFVETTKPAICSRMCRHVSYDDDIDRKSRAGASQGQLCGRSKRATKQGSRPRMLRSPNRDQFWKTADRLPGSTLIVEF